MDNENSQKRFESVYSTKVRAGKRRTYFFDVRKTKGEDFYVTLTESTKRFNSDGYERHKIFLYKEDFNRFIEGLTEAVDYVKNNLMPDYDYNEFARRQAEWEENNNSSSNGAGEANKTQSEHSEPIDEEPSAQAPPSQPEETVASDDSDDEDMSW